jgi:hypothetical protein
MYLCTMQKYTYNAKMYIPTMQKCTFNLQKRHYVDMQRIYVFCRLIAEQTLRRTEYICTHCLCVGIAELSDTILF